MFPPSGGYSLDIEAISGICGSISIACWVVVFSPQIIENFKRSSAEGLSIDFVVIWLLGDVFNILGAVLQGVLPTMIILAVYYTFADLVLLGQCFYYRGFMLTVSKCEQPASNGNAGPSEHSPLISSVEPTGIEYERELSPANIDRLRSRSSFRERFHSLDATHMSPVVPLHEHLQHEHQAADVEPLDRIQPRTWTQAILFNSTAILLVVVAGVAGYYLSPSSPNTSPKDTTPADDQEQTLQFNLWGQIFGYICAILYLGSRIPQILLNFRRKSCEGLNALFFLFAVIGNLTYAFSIFAFEPLCTTHNHGSRHESRCSPGESRVIYTRYLLVNLSWLLGSLGTLILDLSVFVQFWIYRENRADSDLNSGSASLMADGDGRGRAVNQ